MKLVSIVILAVAMTVLFFGGYFVGNFKTKPEKSKFLAVPVTLCIIMVTVIVGIFVIAKSS